MDRRMNTPPATPVSFGQALKFWLWLGCVSFGGPAGQIALMHEELVVRRRWISEQRYLHALHYCMLLPGPEAQQLATYIGWLMHRARGGMAAGVLFVLPSLLLLIGLSWAYVTWGQHPWGQALLWGLKPAVTALVLQAVHRMARRTLQRPWLWGLAALSLAGTLAGIGFPWLVALAAIAGAAVARALPSESPALSAKSNEASAPAWIDDQTPTPPHARYSLGRLLRAAGMGVGLWALTLGGLAWLLGAGHTLVRMGGFFTEAALLTFGGAYAVLPYVTQAAVAHHGWLSAAQMMDGLALGETTPGPLIMVVAFVGFVGGHGQALLGDPLLGGMAAASVVTWFTFLPSFVFILAGGPLVESSRHVPSLAAPLQAIGAAVIGVMLQLAALFAWHTAWPSGQWMHPDLLAIAVTLVAAWLLMRRQWPVTWVLGVCMLAGAGVQWV
jgi:chromate transporter